MYNPRRAHIYDTIVRNVILCDMTNLVNRIILQDELYSEILNNYDEEEDTHIEIYQWLLINNRFRRVIEELHLPHIEIEGNMYLGRTCGGQSITLDGFVRDIESHCSDYSWIDYTHSINFDVEESDNENISEEISDSDLDIDLDSDISDSESETDTNVTVVFDGL